MGVPGIGIDFEDIPGSVTRIIEFNERNPVLAVVGVEDSSIELAAYAAKALGLRTNMPCAIANSRLKHRFRSVLENQGYQTPGFQLLAKGERLNPEVISACRFPSVVKATGLSASRGVIRVDDPQSLSSAVVRTRKILASEGPLADPTLLIEDFIPGREYAIEGILRNDQLHCLAIFDKPDQPDGPYFEESIYVAPARIDDVTRQEMLEVIGGVCRAIGLRYGPVHAECRVNEGGIWLIELAARTIGGQCARLLEMALGVTLEEVVLTNAVGGKFKVPSSLSAVGVMMIPVPGAGVLRRVEGVRSARAVSGVEVILIDAQPGQVLVPWPEGCPYPGFIFARGDSPEMVERALRAAHQRLDFVLAPRLPVQTSDITNPVQ